MAANGEKAVPVFRETIYNSETGERKKLKKIKDGPPDFRLLCIFFQNPSISILAGNRENVNIGPYGKTARSSLGWWVLYKEKD